MKKYTILIAIIFASFLNAVGFEGFNAPKSKFLTPQEAFKVEATSTKDGIKVNINLAGKIHIYKNKLKAKIIKPVSKDLPLNLPKGKIITGEEAYEGNLTLNIPSKEIGLDKDFTLQIDLTGCSDAGICYAPQQYKFNLKPLSSPKQNSKPSPFAGFKAPKTQKFLTPQEAFKVDAKATKNGLRVDINLADKIHIYKNKLKVKVIEPSKKELALNLPKGKIITGEEAYEGTLSINIDNSKIGINKPYKVEVDLSGCSDAGICYAPQKFTFNINPKNATTSTAKTNEQGFFSKISTLAKSGNSKDIANALKNESLIFILLLFFIVGLLLALTPCILPMVPILSSILIQQAGDKGEISRVKSFSLSLVYVVAMAFMYAIIGVIAGLFDFDLQANANNLWVVVPVALIFVALAMSLFGYFELALPSSWQTKLNNISNSAQGNGYIGTAIMGAISALIVGACTAPVISGAIIFISATGDATLGGLALFVMGIGAGVPLLLIGLGAKNLVPKPGGWMENVSKFFAFLMLIMALYIARGVISDTLFMLIFAFILAGMSLFFGAFDKPKGFVGIFKVANFFILIYAVVIFIGAISGAKSILDPLSPFKGGATTTQPVETKTIEKAYTLDELLNEIKDAKKPVVVDIGKENCAACTELANITFPNPKVKEEMERFKFIQLDITKYTDSDRAIMKHFKIFGAPNILFFNSKGEALEDKFQQGFIKPEQFVEILKDIK